MKIYSHHKNMFCMVLLLIGWNMYAMEEWGRENPGTLDRSSVEVFPLEIWEKIVSDVVDVSTTEEAIVTLKRLQCTDQAACAMIQGFLANEKFAATTKEKLAKKAKFEFSISPAMSHNIIEKLFDPAKPLACGSAAFVLSVYWKGAKAIARFFYACSQNQKNKDEFLKEMIIKNDAKTAEFCLNHGADANAKFQGVFGEWTHLSDAIGKGNIGWVKLLLKYKANPDESLKYSRKDGIGGNWIEYHITPRELAQIKDNQEIIALLENHSAAKLKE